MQLVSEAVFRLNMGQANVYVLETAAGIAVIDAASYGFLPRFEVQLKRIGFQLDDIHTILITHAHVDHVGGLKELQEATGARVWAHQLEAPIIRGEQLVSLPAPSDVPLKDRLMASMIRIYVGNKQPASLVSRELHDHEELTDIRAGLTVMPLPGHSPGQIGFYLSEQDVLIAGDVMMHLTPWLTRPLRAFSSDQQQADKTILKLAQRPPRTLALGHGPAILGQADQAIRSLAKKISRQTGMALTSR
jgi:glyoxylase-like metal-dependent hydrolase (beta-lactamase superfamily II)